MIRDPLLTRSLAMLEKSLVVDQSEIPLVSEGSKLYQACQVVAEKMGLSLPRPLKEEPSIDEICALGKIRYRTIDLGPSWWKKDHGPFVAFRKESKDPVALFFNRKRQYLLIDPETGQSEAIDHQVAETLAPEGIALIAPFPEKAKTLRGILAYILSKMSGEYGLMVLFGLAMTFLGFAFPVANKILYDFVIPNYNMTVYYQLFAGLFVIVCSSALFVFARTLLMVRIKGLLTAQIQIGLWDRLLRLPLSFFRSLASGDLLLRTLIFDKMKDRLSNSALNILLNGLFSFAYLIVMFIFSWQLALIGIALILAWGVLALIILLIKIRYEQKLLASTAAIQSFLVQGIQAINKVRSTALESRLFAKWGKDFSYNQSLAYKTLTLQNLIQASSSLMNILLPFSFYSFIIYLKNHAETPQLSLQVMTVGTFLAFLAAFTPFSQGLLGMVVTAASMTEIIPFWRRVRPLLTTPLETVGVGSDPGRLKGQIEVKNLHFRYSPEGPLILKDINLKIAPGQLVGLVGKTGCGKSTLCRLLFGLEQIPQGTIFFDDQDSSEFDLTKLRQQIGFLFQENKIFNGNIYDNLSCGRPCSKEELLKAIQLSTFDRELTTLPMGLETRLSSIGGLLSGGQKQKLLLSRTFLLNPEIYIIDEGLNTLDNTTQEEVLNNIKSLGKTTLLTTHRLNILSHADSIYVMEDGTLTASGTFSELAHKEGPFKRFYDKQAQ